MKSPDYLDAFLRMATEQPTHPAVVDVGQVTTYGQLLSKADAIVAACAGLDAPAMLIGLPQGADAYAAMFAAGLAGGYYAPVNANAPIDKIRSIASRLAPNVVVARPAFFDAIRSLLPQARLIDPAMLEPNSGERAPADKRHRLAYVIFTSGSTGEPKGVVISRDALAHYVAWIGSAMQITPADRWSQHPNIGFDLSVMDIYGALCHGATLFPITSDEDRVLPALSIARNQLTIWNSVPSVVGLMLQAHQVTGTNLASLRLLTFCGEPLLPQHLDALFAARPDVTVQNTYGPTEATVSCTQIRLHSGNYKRYIQSSVAIGEAIPGMDLLLVGGQSETEGEIVITGPQVADGYWKDEQGTQRSFRSVSIGGHKVRGYFTGDWAERRDDTLYFRERVDHQVKIGGFRIELDEVAEAIRDCGWHNVCVIKIDDKLMAVLEEFPGRSLDDGALRKQLQDKLADYAIPNRFLEIERMPRNANDKIDRQAVTELVSSRGLVS